MTRSSVGTALTTSATISRVWSLLSVGKFDSVTAMSEKLTRRESSATLVSASTLIEPSAGFCAPGDSTPTAAYATMCFWAVHSATCGW